MDVTAVALAPGPVELAGASDDYWWAFHTGKPSQFCVGVSSCWRGSPRMHAGDSCCRYVGSYRLTDVVGDGVPGLIMRVGLW